MDYKALGQKIKAERIKLRLTQENLAEDVALSPAYIGQIERGERSVAVDKLVLIANRLGISLDYALSNSLTISQNQYDIVIQNLLNGRTLDEKIMVANILKLIFSSIDNSKKS